MSMMVRTALLAAGVAGFALAAASFSPAQALSMKECSAKYDAAKTGGTLNGQKWNDFRKAQCGADATPAAAAAPATAPAPAAAAPANPLKPAAPAAAAAPAAPAAAAVAKPAAAPAAAAKPAAAPAAPGSAVFPTAVSAKFSSESPGRARLHTCSEQFQANKASNANGGLKWIEKGGGYWSECNKHLKG
jgi:hypothetical protein